jgi:hypothetical protein
MFQLAACQTGDCLSCKLIEVRLMRDSGDTAKMSAINTQTQLVSMWYDKMLRAQNSVDVMSQHFATQAP